MDPLLDTPRAARIPSELDGFRCGLPGMALTSGPSMKSKLLIVADLGLVNGLCWLAAPKQIDQKILEKRPPAVCKRIKNNLPRDLTKVEQKKLLDQFLNADAFMI
jgi:hypothetical protein